MEISKETPDLSLQTESLIKGNNRDQIANPKVVVTETINSKEKIKLRWSMFNLENNNYNQKHSLPMTRKLLASEKSVVG